MAKRSKKCQKKGRMHRMVRLRQGMVVRDQYGKLVLIKRRLHYAT